MEDEGRPRKIRKLDDQLENDAVAVDQFVPVESDASKPIEEVANNADPEAGTSDSEPEDPENSGEGNGTAPSEPLVEDGTKPMSKNQLKKLRKRQAWEAGRDYRKEKRKQKIAEKKSRKRAANEEQGLQGEGDPSKGRRQRPVRVPISFILDCGFDNLMSEKEIISLGAQLTRAYSDNFRAPYQAHLFISSWGGALKQRFDTVLSKHHENWKGVEFDSESFTHTIEVANDKMTGSKGGKLAGEFAKYARESPVAIGPGESSTNGGASGDVGDSQKDPGEQSDPATQTNGQVDSKQADAVSHPDQSHLSLPAPEVVYLTSDSPHILEDLKPYSTYIIGGLVDKNRHKGICYRTACDQGIKTAKLPIREFMEMRSRSVLATNHVVEIMVRWLECGDWGEAFLKVIPKRKGGKLKDAAEPVEGPEHGAEDSETEIVVP